MRWRWRPGSGPRARAGPTAWDGGLVNKVITAASTSSVCLLFVHKLTLSSVIRNLSISSANSDGSRGPREGWPVVCCLSGQSSSVHQLPSPYQDNNITAARQSYKDKSAAAGPVIIISARSRLRADGVVTGLPILLGLGWQAARAGYPHISAHGEPSAAGHHGDGRLIISEIIVMCKVEHI